MQHTAKDKEITRKIRVKMLQGKSCIGSYTADDPTQQIVFGSSNTANIVLPGNRVSSIHAMLRVTANNDVVLYDLGSKTGTYLLGKKIVQSKIDKGSSFQIGGQSFKVDILEDNPQNSPEYKLFWEPRAYKSEILDIAILQEGKLSNIYHLAPFQKLQAGYDADQIYLEGLDHRQSFIERKRIRENKNSEEGAYCFLPPGYKAEIYDGKNQLLGTADKVGEYFCIGERQKARLIGETNEIHIYWRSQEGRLERGTPDPENKRFRESVSVSFALSLLVLAIMHFMPKPVKLEELAEKKSSYYRVTRTEPTTAPAPAPASQSLETVDQVVEKEQKAATNPKTVQQVVQKVTQPEPPKPSQTAVALQNSLSNLLNRAIKTNLPVSDRGRKVMEASIVPSSGGSNGLKTEISGQASAGSVNTAALSQALKQGTQGAAAGLKGFKGGTGVGNVMGNGAPNMDVGLGDSDAESTGGLDKSVIAAVVREHLGQIKHCYERQLLVDPNLFGKVVANWTINGSGIVDASSVKKSTMGNAAVENCVIGKIKTWKFPKPNGGGKVIVSYPFLFKSVN